MKTEFNEQTEYPQRPELSLLSEFKVVKKQEVRVLPEPDEGYCSIQKVGLY